MKFRAYRLQPRISDREKALAKWQVSPFYTSAVTLGLDIGLEGIGIYLRKGREEVFAKTVDISDVLPGTNALEARRQLRHARRNRANRRTRLARLDALLEKHGLPRPWRDNAKAYGQSDPFKLRFRAIRPEGSGLGSKEALAIAIRSCVALRGYDYGRFSEEGEYPWGRSPRLSDALKWLSSATIDEGIAGHLREHAQIRVLATGAKDADVQWAKFEEAIAARLEVSARHSLENVLREHFKGDTHDNLRHRARGYAFPRQKVWEHLERIIRRHAEMIDDVEGFISALNLNPDDKAQFATLEEAAAARAKAVFWYNRKCLLEMEEHWAKKKKDCPYAERLQLGGQKTSARGHRSLRRWSILEFAMTRRVEITYAGDEGERPAGTANGKRKKVQKELLHALTPDAVRKLVDLVDSQYGDDANLLKLDKEQRAEARKKARAIIEEDIRTCSGIAAQNQPKPAPMKKGSWNESFFDQLCDLAAPNVAAGTGALFHKTAEALFEAATAQGTDFTASGYNARLVELGFYDWRRESVLDWGVYPQVEFLLGRRIATGKRKGEVSSSCRGFLRQLFASFQAEGHPLQGVAAADFVTVEVVGDAPRTSQQKEEILKEQKKKRDERVTAFASSGLADSGVASRRRRLSLHGQQKGLCPYTGDPLPDDPLDDRLEIEHIFPAEMGGLSVDENLVLTFKTTNGRKHKQTPLQWLGEAALKARVLANGDMRWSALKREIFTWGLRTEDDPAGKWPKHWSDEGQLLVPDFGNVTRTAQLARQLTAAIADWLGIAKEPQVMAERIATPSGWLVSQALRSWLPDYRKDRSDLTHHLIDAAVLAHIPPREGMNSVLCGGLFYAERVREENPLRPGTFSERVVTRALPGLLDAARLQRWLPNDAREYEECPVLLRKSQSRAGSLGDSTFWRQVDPAKADLAQRMGSPFNPADYKGNANKLLGQLQDMGISERKHRQWSERNARKGLPPPPLRDVLPTLRDIEKYLAEATAALQAERGKTPPVLRLRDGKNGTPWTPISKVWKWGRKGKGKGSLARGLGWSGRRNDEGKLKGLRSLHVKYDRLEIYLGYDVEAARKRRSQGDAAWQEAGWCYQKRLIPDKTALRHLKQMGFSYDRNGDRPAPEFMQDRPDQPETHTTLRDLIQGRRLLPFSKLVGEVKRGMVFKVSYDRDGCLTYTTDKQVWSTFLKVTSTSADNGGMLELKALLISDKSLTPLRHCTQDVLTRKLSTPPDLAALLGLPPAAEQAAKLCAEGKLRAPTIPDDPPPHSPPGRRRRASPAGQADLL